MQLPEEHVERIIIPKQVNNKNPYPFMFPDTRQYNESEYILQKQYSVIYLYSDNRIFLVSALPGFIYDGFSVPKIGRWLQDPFSGAGTPAALFHDLDFCVHFTGCVTKANWAFLVTLQESGVGWFKRNIMYSAVQAAGWALYNKPSEIIAENKRYLEIQQLNYSDYNFE